MFSNRRSSVFLKSILVVWCSGWSVAVASAQTTYYVDGSCGNDSWTGTGPVCQDSDGPKATIQAGISAASDGDTVIVADGTYTGPGNRSLVFGGKAVILRSAGGAANCIIDCEGLGRGFIFYEVDLATTVVDGFTITNGMGHPGGAIYSYYDSSPTIMNCILTGNTGDSGGGGGIYCAMCNMTITNCSISQNTAIGGGGGLYSDGGNPTIANCTITDNTADIGGSGVYFVYGSPTITNSILWGNEPQEIFVDEASMLVVSHSNVEGGWPGSGNIDADPLFTDPGDADYHCLPGSPCIDAADNMAVPEGISTDLDGNPRFVDDPNTPDTGNPDGVNPIVEMGAYEFQDTPPPPCTADLDGDGSVGAADLAMLLGTWGPVPTPDPPDFDGDGDVDASDLAILLGNWGPCL